VGHDGPIENAIIKYQLEILPIYLKFDSHAQLLVPIDNPSDEAIAAWLDDRLVEFTRTYLELYFTVQYQRQSLETDPVMNIRFPRAFAAGKREYRGRTYHFYTKESLQQFEKAPFEYVETTK
jgi:YHS domain-containing protein